MTAKIHRCFSFVLILLSVSSPSLAFNGIEGCEEPAAAGTGVDSGQDLNQIYCHGSSTCRVSNGEVVFEGYDFVGDVDFEKARARAVADAVSSTKKFSLRENDQIASVYIEDEHVQAWVSRPSTGELFTLRDQGEVESKEVRRPNYFQPVYKGPRSDSETGERENVNHRVRFGGDSGSRVLSSPNGRTPYKPETSKAPSFEPIGNLDSSHPNHSFLARSDRQYDFDGFDQLEQRPAEPSLDRNSPSPPVVGSESKPKDKKSFLPDMDSPWFVVVLYLALMAFALALGLN